MWTARLPDGGRQQPQGQREAALPRIAWERWDPDTAASAHGRRAEAASAAHRCGAVAARGLEVVVHSLAAAVRGVEVSASLVLSIDLTKSQASLIYLPETTTAVMECRWALCASMLVELVAAVSAQVVVVQRMLASHRALRLSPVRCSWFGGRHGGRNQPGMPPRSASPFI